MGVFGWQDYAAVKPAQVWRKVQELDLPLALSLGVLGLNGMTAYFGLLDVLHPEVGETVVVSTAAGAVGSVVGQIAKIKGCRAVGIAGGSEKVRQCLEEFGYDAAIDYKAAADLDAALATYCPDEGCGGRTVRRAEDGCSVDSGWSGGQPRGGVPPGKD
jgi:NADPH-dependent curcumin reductase CurA